MDFEKAQCFGDWLHRFEIVAEYHYPNAGVKERCARCGEEIIHVLDSNGNADNMEYLEYHAREALLPQHPLYNHEYGR